MAGTIIADTWQNGDGTQNYKCRAWVNFNGTGTVAIRASGNVSSITDNGTGDYTVNFTTAMSDANYSYNCSGTPVNSAADQCRPYGSTITAQSVSVARFVYVGNSGVIDPLHAVISFFR